MYLSGRATLPESFLVRLKRAKGRASGGGESVEFVLTITPGIASMPRSGSRRWLLGWTVIEQAPATGRVHAASNQVEETKEGLPAEMVADAADQGYSPVPPES
jgi:hypothetical protein